jgi:hypothetical protein
MSAITRKTLSTDSSRSADDNSRAQRDGNSSSHDTSAQNDPVLLPFINAPDDQQADSLLSELLSKSAAAPIRHVIARKLRAAVETADWERVANDCADLSGDILLRLLRQLRALRNNRGLTPIGSFRAYVRSMSQHACDDYLRAKYPMRNRLKKKVRRALTSSAELDLWQNDNRSGSIEWICGLSSWRHLKASRQPAADCFVPALTLPKELGDCFKKNGDAARTLKDLKRPSMHLLLIWIFNSLGRSVELDRLVGIVGELLEIREAERNVVLDEETIYDQRGDVVGELLQSATLKILWAEICELPLRQRMALLLNLRDAEGRSAIILFPALGVASITVIAAALEMAVEEFAVLWNDLPLDDATISRHLGITRQQVINLRKSARARLARRVKSLDR